MSPVSSHAQAQVPETPAPVARVTIFSASTCSQLSGAKEGLLLRSVMDTATGAEFVPRAGEGLPLWETVLLDPERKLTSVRATDGTVGIVFLSVSEQPQAVRFKVRGQDYGFAPGRPPEVTALSLGPDEKALREPCADLAGGVGVIERTPEGRGMWAPEVRTADRGR